MSGPSEVIFCGVCGKVVFRHVATPIRSRTRIPSRAQASGAALLTQMMEDAESSHQQMLARAEEACATHFATQHPLRLRLGRRLKWKWLLQRRWPWSRARKHEEFSWDV